MTGGPGQLMTGGVIRDKPLDWPNLHNLEVDPQEHEEHKGDPQEHKGDSRGNQHKRGRGTRSIQETLKSTHKYHTSQDPSTSTNR